MKVTVPLRNIIETIGIPKMSSSNSNRKRAPFGEATANNIGNRNNKAMAPSSNIPPPSSVMGKRRKDPPSSAPMPSIRVKNNGIRSKSRQRQRPGTKLPPEPEQEVSVSTSDAHASPSSGAKARLYKAVAYESKIRLASQQQQIEALQAELSEVKLFKEMEMEQSGKVDSEKREKKSRDDAELIEALAQELETMEKDYNESQKRVGELEKDLLDMKSKTEADIVAATQLEKAQWGKREAELKEQLENTQKELTSAIKDTTMGMTLMKELDGALKSARVEREDARSQLATLRAEMQQQVQDDTERKAVVKELGITLVAMQNERDKALAKVAELKESLSKCANVEKSHKELQKALETVQIQTGKKIDQMKQAVLESQMREEKLKHDNETLVKSYDEKVKESHELESAMSELEDEHATNMATLTKDNSLRMEEMEMKMDDMRKEITDAHAKNKAFEAVESNYISEIASLKNSVNELERSMSMEAEAPDDELASSLQIENSKLRAEKADLIGKLQRGLEIHKKTTLELEAKTLELQNCGTLKKDYTSAVALVQDRGKQIQSLEKEVITYRSQLTKAAKKLSKKTSAEEQLQTEVSSLKTKTWEAEATITALQEELTLHSTKASHTEELERELASAQKVNDESLLKISHLEEALQDMQVALKAVSSRKLSPRSSPDPIECNGRRKDIEDNALAEYFSQRVQAEKGFC